MPGSPDALRTLHTIESKALAIPAPPSQTPMVTPAGSSWGQGAYPATEPMRTLTTYDVNALLTPYYGASEYAQPVTQPVGTLTTVDRYALVHRNNTGGPEMSTPVTEYLRTLTTAGHQSLIQPPAAGARPRARPQVTPADLKAAEDMVSSCHFRMFTPGEVAAGMAFPADYRWDVRDHRGRAPSRRDLVKMAGNAVCPPAARDLMGVITPALDGAA